MVNRAIKEGSPGVTVGHTYTDIGSAINDTENIVAMVIESNKGDPFRPEEVTKDKELFAKFKINEPEFFGAGGFRLIGIRATVGDVTPAKHILKIGTEELELELFAGDYPVYITAGFNDGLNRLTLEEQGMETEKYSDPSIAGLAKKIKRNTKILNNFNPDFGALELITDNLDTLVKTKFGTGTDNTPGSNGEANADGSLKSADQKGAHEKALEILQTYTNPEMGIIYLKNSDPLLQAIYLDHIDTSNLRNVGKWRCLIIAAPTDTTPIERINLVKSCDSENVWVVCHDAIKNNVLYTPEECVPAVAGHIARFAYNVPPYGGTDKKVIGNGFKNLFDDIGTIYYQPDFDRMNEAGCLTFEKDEYGVKLREDVTSAQPESAETDTDRIFTVRVVQHAKRILKRVGKEMIGEPITDTTNTELQQAATEELKTMKEDKALIDVYDEDGKLQYKAIDVSVNVITKADMTIGKVDWKAKINPSNSLRQTNIDVEVS